MKLRDVSAALTIFTGLAIAVTVGVYLQTGVKASRLYDQLKATEASLVDFVTIGAALSSNLVLSVNEKQAILSVLDEVLAVGPDQFGAEPKYAIYLSSVEALEASVRSITPGKLFDADSRQDFVTTIATAQAFEVVAQVQQIVESLRTDHEQMQERLTLIVVVLAVIVLVVFGMLITGLYYWMIKPVWRLSLDHKQLESSTNFRIEELNTIAAHFRDLSHSAELLERFRGEIFNDINMPMLRVSRDFRITEGNRAYHAAIACSPEEEALLSEKMAVAFGAGGEIEFCLHRPEGDTWLEMVIFDFDVDFEEDTGTHFLATLRDVTERRRSAESAQRSDRLESIGRLTGGIAHDFNNILTIVVGNAEILSEDSEEDSDTRELADSILAAAERGSDLTKRLLAFARRQPLDPKPTDLRVLIEEMKPLFLKAVDAGFDVGTSFASETGFARIDPGQLEAALLNLVINARDAMPDGGKIMLQGKDVTVTSAEEAGPLDISPGKYVCISVTDTGTGMSQAVLNRALEPFFTTKTDGRGNGMGLPMVYGFVKQSGGQIRIDTEEGRGTCIELYLPWAEPEKPVITTEQVVTRANTSGQAHILVVEDEVALRESVCRTLKDFGHKISQAGTGGEALSILKSDRSIDMVFTDIVMPGGINGFELARQAKELYPHLKILFTSGYSQDAALKDEEPDVAAHFLNKPYRRTELEQAVTSTLEEVVAG